MKKGNNFGVIVSMFVACCVLLCSCANVGHNQAESAQVDLSRVDVCGIYLGEDSSYDGTVKEGYKPVCYVLYVENHSHYKMENMMMQQINNTQISLRANTTHIMKAHFSYHHLKAVLR